MGFVAGSIEIWGRFWWEHTWWMWVWRGRLSFSIEQRLQFLTGWYRFTSSARSQRVPIENGWLHGGLWRDVKHESVNLRPTKYEKKEIWRSWEEIGKIIRWVEVTEKSGELIWEENGTIFSRVQVVCKLTELVCKTFLFDNNWSLSHDIACDRLFLLTWFLP